MAKKTSLNEKQGVFVDEYLKDLNATQAAIRAGYSANTAKMQGSRLMTNDDIAAAIAERMEKRAKRVGITQDSVLADIEAIKADAMQAVPDKDGNMAMLDRPAALKSCELLAKHLGMFAEKVELTGADGGPIDHSITVRFVKPSGKR